MPNLLCLMYSFVSMLSALLSSMLAIMKANKCFFRIVSLDEQLICQVSNMVDMCVCITGWRGMTQYNLKIVPESLA